MTRDEAILVVLNANVSKDFFDNTFHIHSSRAVNKRTFNTHTMIMMKSVTHKETALANNGLVTDKTSCIMKTAKKIMLPLRYIYIFFDFQTDPVQPKSTKHHHEEIVLWMAWFAIERLMHIEYIEP